MRKDKKNKEKKEKGKEKKRNDTWSVEYPVAAEGDKHDEEKDKVAIRIVRGRTGGVGAL